MLGLFAILLAFAAAGGMAFTWWKVLDQRANLAEHDSRAATQLDSLNERVAAVQERVAAQGERLEALSRDVEARSRALGELERGLGETRAWLDQLAREDASPERAPMLAEIEFLLLLARRELMLGDNSRVALAALREADGRLARLEGPGLRQVRGAINDEIAAIEAVASRDLEGIALRLASLARQVEGLPLRASLAPGLAPTGGDAEAASGWERFVARLQSLASGLFRIRRSDAPAAPLLAPDESFFLYRNVELDLKSARLAVLARDPANYAAGLEAARRALEEYFETDDPAVQSVLDALEELVKREVAPQWPEISRSLELLRSARMED
jgi:uroporphyrin-III C-methyltransferase